MHIFSLACTHFSLFPVQDTYLVIYITTFSNIILSFIYQFLVKDKNSSTQFNLYSHIPHCPLIFTNFSFSLQIQRVIFLGVFPYFSKLLSQFSTSVCSFPSSAAIKRILSLSSSHLLLSFDSYSYAGQPPEAELTEVVKSKQCCSIKGCPPKAEMGGAEWSDVARINSAQLCLCLLYTSRCV